MEKLDTQQRKDIYLQTLQRMEHHSQSDLMFLCNELAKTCATTKNDITEINFPELFEFKEKDVRNETAWLSRFSRDNNEEEFTSENFAGHELRRWVLALSAELCDQPI